uniref:Uncharacterized protein n=1 Tax=Anguilla anguilla TaxID=7936 RepID=A0A0E9WYA9_ANGAN
MPPASSSRSTFSERLRCMWISYHFPSTGISRNASNLHSKCCIVRVQVLQALYSLITTSNKFFLHLDHLDSHGLRMSYSHCSGH